MPPPIDTNVIIREITRDDARLSARAHAFLQRLSIGTAEALLTEAVLVECVQVLSSRALYNLPRAEIARDLGVIVRLRGIRLPNKRRYLRALALYAGLPALDFVDALLAVYAESQDPAVVVSFDEDFDHAPGVTRLAP
jgi:predicted nucleic acid-binding protein